MKKLLALVCLTVGFTATAEPRSFNACLQYQMGGGEWSKPFFKHVTLGTGEEIDQLTGCEQSFGCYDDTFSQYILIDPWANGDYTVLKVGNAMMFEPRMSHYSEGMKGDDRKTWRIAEHTGSATSCPKQ